jgi:molybdopterin-containing oxidoreductase family membrane subunit
MTGPYAWSWWTIVFCNVLVPQVLWFGQVRRNVAAMFFISILVQIGMWTERFVIVITSLHRDFMPSAWGMYEPTIWDWSILLGTMGFFLFCFFLFIRLFPVISMAEVRELVHSTHGGEREPEDFEPKYAE